MSNIKYIYKFKFNNGVEKEFNITLDSETLHLISERKDEYP